MGALAGDGAATRLVGRSGLLPAPTAELVEDLGAYLGEERRRIGEPSWKPLDRATVETLIGPVRPQIPLRVQFIVDSSVVGYDGAVRDEEHSVGRKEPAVRSESGSEKTSSPWRPTKKQVLWAIGMMVALLTTALLIVNLYPEIWKSLLEERNLTLIAIGVSLTAIIVLLSIGGAVSRWTGFRGMTVRDWSELLIIPMVLVGIGLLFEMQQAGRQQATEMHQQRLAEQRAQDEALQAYVDEVGRLMLEKDLRDPMVKTILRARTITVLGRLDPSEGRLDPSGKTAVMQFLVEADLVQGEEGKAPTISLRSADLRKAYLFGANLFDADLRNADLTEANLSGANLSEANLHRATLTDADLTDADLSNAHLTDASGITNEELDQQAETLEGATMPDGQKYEEWLKDKEG